MLLYITKQPTNIPALFAMTVHHKTLEDPTTEQFFKYTALWFTMLSRLMQEAVFEASSPISDSYLQILHRSP